MDILENLTEKLMNLSAGLVDTEGQYSFEIRASLVQEVGNFIIYPSTG